MVTASPSKAHHQLYVPLLSQCLTKHVVTFIIANTIRVTLARVIGGIVNNKTFYSSYLLSSLFSNSISLINSHCFKVSGKVSNGTHLSQPSISFSFNRSSYLLSRGGESGIELHSN